MLNGNRRKRESLHRGMWLVVPGGSEFLWPFLQQSENPARGIIIPARVALQDRGPAAIT